MHSLEDPLDVLDYDAFDLIDHASALGYHVLALTLHRRLFFPPELAQYAQSRGILLIPGIEAYLDRKEVLLFGVNPNDLIGLKTLNDLRALKKSGTELLVIAPHPFYGFPQCVGDQLETFSDVFDALEYCHFYTPWWNPNLKAEKVAQKLGKPMIACSDTHQLKWMKEHYTLLDADPTITSIFAAIRAGLLKNVTRPLTNAELIQKLTWHIAHEPQRILRRFGWVQRPAYSTRKAASILPEKENYQFSFSQTMRQSDRR